MDTDVKRKKKVETKIYRREVSENVVIIQSENSRYMEKEKNW